jgi:hypothetical protein
MSEKTTSPADRIAAIQKQRQARKDALHKQCEEQRANDLEALAALEDQHGSQAIAAYEIDPDRWTPGLPTLVVVHVPDSAFNRYRTMVRKAKGNHEAMGAAGDMLGDVSVAYPESDVYRELRKAYQGLHDNIAVIAVKLAEGRAADEGKG